MEAAKELAEEEKNKPKAIAQAIQGIVMDDGLIHTKDGQIFFQDGEPVKGVNLDWTS